MTHHIELTEAQHFALNDLLATAVEERAQRPDRSPELIAEVASIFELMIACNPNNRVMLAGIDLMRDTYFPQM